MEFTSFHTVFKDGHKPITLEALHSLYEKWLMDDVILKLKVGEHHETDFRIITRIK